MLCNFIGGYQSFEGISHLLFRVEVKLVADAIRLHKEVPRKMIDAGARKRSWRQ
jgi:hypothetical protein